jgi:hypothetical protein
MFTLKYRVVVMWAEFGSLMLVAVFFICKRHWALEF